MIGHINSIHEIYLEVTLAHVGNAIRGSLKSNTCLSIYCRHIIWRKENVEVLLKRWGSIRKIYTNTLMEPILNTSIQSLLEITSNLVRVIATNWSILEVSRTMHLSTPFILELKKHHGWSLTPPHLTLGLYLVWTISIQWPSHTNLPIERIFKWLNWFKRHKTWSIKWNQKKIIPLDSSQFSLAIL